MKEEGAVSLPVTASTEPRDMNPATEIATTEIRITVIATEELASFWRPAERTERNVERLYTLPLKSLEM